MWQSIEENHGKRCGTVQTTLCDYNNDVVRIARELNHYTIQWDVDSLDWKPGITAEEIKPGA